MITNETNPLYPFMILNDVTSLFREYQPVWDLDKMIYKPYDDDDDDPNEPYHAMHGDIPLCSYIFETDLIPNLNCSLKLRSYNIRSSTLHLDAFLDNHNTSFDILCLCETLLTDDISQVPNIEPFQSFHQCRRDRDGGGVSLYVRSAFSPVHLPQLSFSSDCLEAVAAQFAAQKGKRDVVISVYRPPSTSVPDFIVKLEALIKKARELNVQNVYIAGDINIDLLKKEKQDTINLVNLMHTYNFYCTINKPTRVTATSATIIDHIWVSDLQNIRASYIIVEDMTDHYPVESHFAVNSPRVPQDIQSKLRRFPEHSKNAFMQELAQIQWDNVTSRADPNDAYNIFFETFFVLYDKHFPLQNIKIKYKNRDDAYLTAALKGSIREKRRLHRLAKKYPITYYDRYIRYRDVCNNAVKTARNMHYQRKLQSSAGDARSLWREINGVMGRKSHSVDPLIELPEGSTMNHSNYINNYFNEAIQSLKTNQASANPNDFEKYLNPETDFSLCLHRVSEDEILKYIKENKSNAAGYDGIDPKIVKMAADIIKYPLVHIINRTFKTGIFPDRLKVAKIIPLH